MRHTNYVMSKKRLFIKYLIVNLICLVVFIAINSICPCHFKNFRIYFNLPSFVGTIVLTNLFFPLIVDTKRFKYAIFSTLIFFGVVLMIIDEYSTFFSNNQTFDYADIVAIFLGGISTFVIYYKHFKTKYNE